MAAASVDSSHDARRVQVQAAKSSRPLFFAQTGSASVESSVPERKKTVLTPVTPQEMWARILVLLAKDEGYVTRQDVEDVLGIQFTHTEKEGEKRYLGAEYFHDFYQKLPDFGWVSIGLFEDPKFSSISVYWYDYYRFTKPL